MKLPVLPSFSRCTGCFGCVNACPAGAIRMALTPEGFYCPGVDTEKCIQCGLCTKHCPVISPLLNPNRSADKVKAFAAWTKNEHIRAASSSGGLFTTLARIFLEQGGEVYGAAWGYDWTVSHVMAKSED